MKVTVLGSGTSHGIPVIGCSCKVCVSADPRDKRTRSSILIEHENVRIVIDTGTDFRFQALRAGLRRLDALLMTHSHAHNLHGLDATRPLTYEKPLAIYGSTETIAEIPKRFAYIFTRTQIGGGKPRLELHDHRGKDISLGNLIVTPVPVQHGSLCIYGYRIGNFAYITDCSSIPESSLHMLAGVDVLIINALRYRSHPTHFTIDEAVEASRRIGARETWLTHLCHDVSHAKLTEELQLQNVQERRVLPAYDGLEITAVAAV